MILQEIKYSVFVNVKGLASQQTGAVLGVVGYAAVRASLS